MSVDVPIKRIESPAGAYGRMLWLADGWLVGHFEPNPDILKGTDRLWRVRLDGSGLEMLNLPVDERRCRRTDFVLSELLNDGRIEFRRTCKPLNATPTTEIMTWDPRTGATDIVFNYPLPKWSVFTTLAPDRSRGLMTEAIAIQSKLYLLEKSGWSEFNLGLVRAYQPRWSPNGQWIALLGNRAVSGRP
ncbi:MAG: hypothetical protein HY330_06645, partial [Chloroflexi bacterium]|nr:hypothetical protein [Chloroflexota bacterium]